MSDPKEIGVKLYLNGFPKSGTHAINSMAMMALPSLTKANWLGNIHDHAFSTRIGKGNVPKALDEFYSGRFAKGHMAYTPEIAEAFQRNHICKVFIFRDFRDVAVSATFHALAHKKNHFPNIEFYQTLKFDEVLKRVITGDEHISGVMDRWELFAPWLDEDWVLKLTYEDFIEHKEGVARLFLRYIYGKTVAYTGQAVEIDGKDFEMAVSRITKSMDHPEYSVTYRNGKTGEWKKYFTDEHKQLFQESDKQNWIERLGYDDRNW